MVEVIAGGAFQARALLVALRLGDRRRVTYALAYHAMYLGSSGVRVGLARRAVARAAELARACESQFLVAWARAAEGIVEFFAGRYAYAISCLSEAEVALREPSVGTAAEINHVRVFIVMALRVSRQPMTVGWWVSPPDARSADAARTGPGSQSGPGR